MTEQSSYLRYYYRQNKEKFAAYKRQHRAKTNAWIAEIKMKSGCVDCGYRKHHAALDFDHVRGEKKFGIGGGGKGDLGRAAILREMAKCEVVCANCHRIRTYERRQEALTG